MSVIKNPITGRDKYIVDNNAVFDAITGRQIGIIEDGVVKSITTGAAIATISNGSGGSGGSIDLSFITAGAEDILEGKVGADVDGNPVYGTLIIPGGSSMEFYKCAAVYGFNKTPVYKVSTAGTAEVNGNYIKTDAVSATGGEVWKHESAEYYLYYDTSDGNRWYIGTGYTPNTHTVLYYIYSSVLTDPAWSYDTGALPPPTVSAGQLVEEVGEKTWSGYKAVLTDGVYSFEETATEGLSYTIITPEVDGIYSADALITVSYVYAGMPEAYLDLPLSTDYNGTLNGVTTDFSSGVVGSLSFADGALNFPGGDSYLNLPGVTTDLLQGDFTIFMLVNQTSHDRTAYVAAQDDCFIGIDDYNGKYNMWAGRDWSWSILQADSGGRDDSGNGSVDRVYDQDIALTYVHKGNTWQLYVNDVLSVEKTREGNIGTGNTLRLAKWGGNQMGFAGKMWNFKLFREALPLPLIQKLIESANKPTEPDNGGGDTATDTPVQTFDPAVCSVCGAASSGMYPTCKICGRAYCFDCIDMGTIPVKVTQCDTCYKSVCEECAKTHSH